MFQSQESEKPSAKKYDINDWPEIESNPISAAGVYPYLGANVSDQFRPDEIVNVYRPFEELADPECINSFKLLPWINDHEMLGDSTKGLTPAEEKGVHGVIGEKVYADEKDQKLKGNLKYFSETLGDLIRSGKVQLSAGYQCVYEIKSGVYNGIPYQAIQRKIRGNHLALVEEGRCGPDVAVMDQFKFTFDQAEKPIMAEKDVKDESPMAEKKEAKDESVEVSSKLDRVLTLLEKLVGMEAAEATDGDNTRGDGDTKRSEDEADKEKAEDEADKEKAEDESEKKADKAKAMDSKTLSKAMDSMQDAMFKEIAQRDELAGELTNHIGEFEYTNKRLHEVVSYAMDKLDLSAPKGQELVAITSYLRGARRNLVAMNVSSTAMDAKEPCGLDNYLKETK